MSNQVEQIREKLQNHIDLTKTDLAADIITMYLYDVEHGRPFLATGAGLRDVAAFRRGIPDLNRAVGDVVREGTPIFANNVLNHPNLIGPFVYREGVRSVALLPVKKSTGELMGLIYINYRQLTPFDDEFKQKILKRVKELSAAIEKEIAAYTKDTPLYRQIAPVESQTRIEIILHQSVESVRNSLGSFSIAIWMPNEKGELTLEYGANIHQRFFGEQTPLNSRDFAVSAFNNQQKTKVETIKGSKNFLHKDMAKALRWRAALAFPLVAPNYRSSLGVLCAYTIDHLIITHSEETILESFATSISAQIESDRRYKSLNLMNELGASLLQTLDLTEIKRRIVEVTTTITQADLCVLHLFDAAKNQFLPRSQSAILRDKVEVQLVERPRESGLSAHILARGWYELEDISKLNKNLTLSSFFQDEGIQSLLGVRLEAQNQPLGVLIVGFRKQRIFTVDESTIVRSLSYFATLAIVQAHLYEQRLSFARASNRITKAQNRDELLKNFLEDCLKLTNSEQGAVGIINYKTREIDITHSVNQPEGFSVPAGQGLMAEAMETRKPVLENNVGRNPRYYMVDPHVKSELDVPLVVENRVIGVLNAKSTRPDAYTEEHQEMLVELADEAAAALYRFTLDERIRHRATLSRKIAEAGSRDELLSAALNGMADLIGSETSLYGIVNRRTGGIRMVQRGSEQVGGWDIPEGKGLTRYAAEKGTYVYSGNVKTDPRYKEHYVDTHPDTASEFDISLLTGGKTFGVLSFQSPRRDAFTQEDIDTALAVADEVAVALYRFNLQERLRVTDEFGEELTASGRLVEAEIFELILQKVIEIIEANHMYIALFDEPEQTIRFSLVYEDGGLVDIEHSGERWQPRREGNGRTERIIATGKPVIVKTAKEAKVWRGKPGTAEYEKTFWRSWIGVPMRVGEKTLGVIVAFNPEQEGFFNTDDLQILQSLGNKAAIALDNARLHFNLNQRLGALTRVTKELTEDIFRTDSEIVERIHQFLKDVVITENMYIALYDKSTDTVHFALAYDNGTQVDTENHPDWEPRRGGKGRTEWIIKNRDQIFISNIQEAEAWYEQPDRKEYQGGFISPSWLGVPMYISDRVFGVIALYNNNKEYVYNSEDLTVVQSLADLGAVLLDNARLYREARGETVAAKQLATLGTAMALIQHRINNSFNLITPNVRRLRKRVNPNDATAAEILDLIDRNADYGSKMIDEIQEKLKNVEERQPVNINQLLNEVLDETALRWQADSQNGNIQFQRHLGEGIPEINAPIVQVDELLTNLVDNAYRAMDGKGQLVVSTELSNNHVIIRVKDSGKGIPDEVLDRLFKKPIAKSTLEKTHGGTGLGLWLNSLSLGTIGGTIEVESTGKEGTTFLVKIPIQ